MRNYGKSLIRQRNYSGFENNNCNRLQFYLKLLLLALIGGKSQRVLRGKPDGREEMWIYDHSTKPIVPAQRPCSRGLKLPLFP